MTDSKKIEDGGPAFARSGFFHSDGRSVHDNIPEDGMSLRDWFAGQAIGTVIDRCSGDTRRPHEHQTDYFARVAYEVADAMIIARKAGEA